METSKSKFVIPESSLPMTGDKIYHLSIRPEDLAEYVITVGDPERVPWIADNFLASVTASADHRGLRTITGPLKDAPDVNVTVVTSGMGQASAEIMFNELVALHEIELKTREPKAPRPQPLTVIRVGTTGALRTDTPLGTSVITRCSVGLDNTGLYYDVAPTEAEAALEKRVEALIREKALPGSRFGDRLAVYAAEASPVVVEALSAAGKQLGFPHKVGITASASGFFANQGRHILPSMQPTVPDIDSVLGELELGGIKGMEDCRFENMEMETSGILHLGRCAGYRCGAVCCTVVQRRAGLVLEDQKKGIENAVAIAVAALISIARADAKKP